MSGRSCRPCAFRHSCSIVEPMRWFRLNWAVNWQRKFPTPNSSNTLTVTTPTGPAMSKGAWRHRGVLTGHRESSSIDLERVLATVLFTDIVDSTRAPPRWAIRHGVDCWTVMISWRVKWSKASRNLDQDDRRWNSGNIRRTWPRSSLRFGTRNCLKTDRCAVTCGSPYRRN